MQYRAPLVRMNSVPCHHLHRGDHRVSSLSARQSVENLSFPLDYYLYHEAVGVVLIAIPKVGCSTIKRWFMRHASADLSIDPHKYAYEYLALSRRDPAQARELLASRRVIMPVRDPAERLRSAFIDKFVWPKFNDLFEPARDIIEDLHRARGTEVVHDTVEHATLGENVVQIPISSSVDYSRRPSFAEFVDYVCTAQEDHLDGHWRCQASFSRGHRVDALVPLEYLSAMLARLSRSLGVDASMPEPENVTRKDPTSQGLLADVSATELHERDLFPLLDELADASLQNRIRTVFGEDAALLERARQQVGLTSPAA